MGEAKRRKKADSGFGQNKLKNYLIENSLKKGRGILLLWNLEFCYMSCKEFKQFFVKDNPANKKRFKKALSLIEKYDINSEIVIMAAAPPFREINLFVSSLEEMTFTGEKYKNMISFTPCESFVSNQN